MDGELIAQNYKKLSPSANYMDEKITETTRETFGLIRGIGAVVDEVRDIASGIDPAAAGAPAPDLPPIIRRGLAEANARTEALQAEFAATLAALREELCTLRDDIDDLRATVSEQVRTITDQAALIEEMRTDRYRIESALLYQQARDRGEKVKEYLEAQLAAGTLPGGWDGNHPSAKAGVNDFYILPHIVFDRTDCRAVFANDDKLLYAEGIEFADTLADGSVNANMMFYKCSGMLRVPHILNSGKIGIWTGTFYGCPALTDWPDYNYSNGTHFDMFFAGCTIRQVREIHLPKAKDIHYICPASLERLGAIHAPLATNVTAIQVQTVTRADGIDMDSAQPDQYGFIVGNIPSRLTALTYLLLHNLGKSTCTSYRLEFPSWGTGSDENRGSLVDSLLTNSHDRAAAGMPAVTVQLSSRSFGLLTDEEKAAITAKGFTLTTR